MHEIREVMSIDAKGHDNTKVPLDEYSSIMNYRKTHKLRVMEEPDYNFSDGTHGPRDNDDWAHFKDKKLINVWTDDTYYGSVADGIGRDNIIRRVKEAVEELD